MEVRFLKLAERLLTLNGFNIEISKKILGDFDVENGEYNKTYNLTSGKAIYLELKEGDFKNKSFQTDEIKCSLLCYSNSIIDTSCNISFSGEQYKILQIEKIKVKQTTIIYKILLG